MFAIRSSIWYGELNKINLYFNLEVRVEVQKPSVILWKRMGSVETK
jgi:hypothetical protein